MRKIAAHYIFPINGEPVKLGVVTIDDDGTIMELSQSNENLQETASVEFYNGIIVPGFVNAHCHLELSHMRGMLPQGGGMGAFCDGVMSMRNHTDTAKQHEAALQTDAQMYAEGIVAVGDISNADSSFAVKKQSRIQYHTFVECLGFGNNYADTIIQNALNIAANAHRQGLAASITPHAPYSMSEKLFARSMQLANKSGLLSVHNQESKEEMELFATGNSKLKDVFEKHGLKMDAELMNYRNSIDRILKYIATDTRSLFIHNVRTTAEDYERATAANARITWVLCPNSNLYIENALPPVNMLRSKGALIAIGTDSLSSNTNLSMIDELKTLQEDFAQIPLHELLCWATLGGAKALKKDKELGSLDIGKRPGLTIIENIDFDNMRITPFSNTRNLLV